VADTPALCLAQGARLGNHYPVTDLASIFRVMSLKVTAAPNIFFIQRMLNKALHLDHNGFIHFIADNGSNDLSFTTTLFHMRP
jgi:hypothetical protein